jgi:uncharacterized protein
MSVARRSALLSAMDRTRFRLAPGIVLDARRAAWLEAERVLAVADLHLGYAWAQRTRGMLLPLSAKDDSTARLLALAEDYAPREVVLLGDIVHRAVPLEPLRGELRALYAALAPRTALRFLVGNHDRDLAPLLLESGIESPLAARHSAGAHTLTHGDDGSGAAESGGGFTIMGHEHPAITIGDGVTSVKCPCFLASERVLVLPAFSAWAAGSNVRSGSFMSPVARAARFSRAFAILAGKLLPVPLSRAARPSLLSS